jgi:hypothetical protein
LPGARLARIVMMIVVVVMIVGLVLSTVAYPLAF